jgi:hypothetical protein
MPTLSCAIGCKPTSTGWPTEATDRIFLAQAALKLRGFVSEEVRGFGLTADC